MPRSRHYRWLYLGFFQRLEVGGLVLLDTAAPTLLCGVAGGVRGPQDICCRPERAIHGHQTDAGTNTEAVSIPDELIVRERPVLPS